ncbi:MAG: large subunit ribosomal protein [Thermoplasmata archaeon]|jgi:large subunit ribosomal protein L12|nr:large subunit ribosomal protein [Thermoplasmata archaeon]
MEYVYSALLLHSAKKEINEAHVTAVLKAAGVTADAGRVKALVAALEGADIAAAIKNASVAPVAMAAAPAGAAAAPKAEEKPEEKGVSEEEAAAGLGALFG